MSLRFSCARDAQERGEALCATASHVRRWLLLEQDGPWGRDAVLESRLDLAAARALKARARSLGARLLLIRRHGRHEAGPPVAYAAVTAERGSWAEEFELDEPAGLLDVDLRPLAEDRPSGGREVDRPLYLVCTNGRHDACCAEFGRPLARALATAYPDRTWECSHVGGDRFAANLVCLPEGVYYGRLGPLEARRVAQAHDGGRLVLDHYRGRSCYPFAVQAAEYLLRRELGLERLDDLSVLDTQRGVVGDTRAVTFETAAGERHVVEVEVSAGAQPQRLTCHAAQPSMAPRYTLRSHTVGPAPR